MSLSPSYYKLISKPLPVEVVSFETKYGIPCTHYAMNYVIEAGNTTGYCWDCGLIKPMKG